MDNNVKFGSLNYYEDWFYLKYNMGIYNINNNTNNLPWAYECARDFSFFRNSIDNLSIWERLYKPGVVDFTSSFCDVKLDYKISLEKELGNFMLNKVPNFPLLEKEKKAFLWSESLSIDIEKQFNVGGELGFNTIPKGVVANDFVVSIGSATEPGKLDSYISFSRIIGPGDLMDEDRIRINPYSSTDPVDKFKNFIDLIKHPDPVDLSYLEKGQDVYIDISKEKGLQGIFGFEKIVNEINPLPSLNFVINAIYCGIGLFIVYTMVSEFYEYVKEVKESLDLQQNSDFNYDYWEFYRQEELQNVIETTIQEINELKALKILTKDIEKIEILLDSIVNILNN